MAEISEVYIQRVERHVAELQQDVAFLAQRASLAGTYSSNQSERETGASSNSIVDLAYGMGLMALSAQTLPGDEDDLRACERMYLKLPHHRKTVMVTEAMNRARKYNVKLTYAEACQRVAHNLLQNPEHYAHCARIANAIGTDHPATQALAWVHMLTDIKDVTFLRDAGVGEYTLDLAQRMRHRGDETYSAYIQRMSKDEMTKQVMWHKLQDWLKQDIVTGMMRDKYELARIVLERTAI